MRIIEIVKNRTTFECDCGCKFIVELEKARYNNMLWNSEEYIVTEKKLNFIKKLIRRFLK